MLTSRRVPVGPILITLAVAGLLELVLLRILYRVGLFIPRDGPLLDGYRLATALGSLAFDVVSVLALVALAGLVAERWRASPLQTGGMSAVLTLALAVAFAPSGPAADMTRALLAVAIIAASLALAAPAVRAGRPAAERLGLGCVTATVIAAQYAAAASGSAAALDGAFDAPLAVEALRLAELAATVAAFALAAAALLAARPDRPAVAITVAAAGTVAVLLAAQPYLFGIVLLWAAGLTLALPAPVYAAAFAALVLALVTELRAAARPRRGLALLLLLAAGVVPQSSAHSVLALLAVALLADDR